MQVPPITWNRRVQGRGLPQRIDSTTLCSGISALFPQPLPRNCLRAFGTLRVRAVTHPDKTHLFCTPCQPPSRHLANLESG